mmetsp:Transcript_76651/g.213060  ORF Transcript_76651/g.213060 Transcript_76651/m.213060 type:complete len:204 (+) Transcript_76651:509-1120(+)
MPDTALLFRRARRLLLRSATVVRNATGLSGTWFESRHLRRHRPGATVSAPRTGALRFRIFAVMTARRRLLVSLFSLAASIAFGGPPRGNIGSGAVMLRAVVSAILGSLALLAAPSPRPIGNSALVASPLWSVRPLAVLFGPLLREDSGRLLLFQAALLFALDLLLLLPLGVQPLFSGGRADRSHTTRHRDAPVITHLPSKALT